MCSKKTDNPSPAPTSVVKKAQFKVMGSLGVKIDNIVYAIDSKTTPVLGVSGSTWLSPQIELANGTKVFNLTANANGDASSNLNLQIFVDGNLKKETSVNGSIMNTFIQIEI
jgi:hypothetical protein